MSQQSSSVLGARFVAADVRIQARRIDDVVAVRTSGNGFEVRRGIGIGDAERVEIVHNRACVTEREVAVELQPVG